MDTQKKNIPFKYEISKILFDIGSTIENSLNKHYPDLDKPFIEGYDGQNLVAQFLAVLALYFTDPTVKSAVRRARLADVEYNTKRAEAKKKGQLKLERLRALSDEKQAEIDEKIFYYIKNGRVFPPEFQQEMQEILYGKS